MGKSTEDLPVVELGNGATYRGRVFSQTTEGALGQERYEFSRIRIGIDLGFLERAGVGGKHRDTRFDLRE